MSQDNIQPNEAQPTEQEAQPTVSDESVDYKALYLDEVQNAKKLRKRAQDSELQNQEYKKAQETLKVKQMKEQNKYKELYEEVAPFKEKWTNYEANRKDQLLSKLPEEDRESLSSKDLDTLEYIVNMKESSKPVNPQHQPNASRKVVTDKPYEQMNENERRQWHEDMMKNY